MGKSCSASCVKFELMAGKHFSVQKHCDTVACTYSLSRHFINQATIAFRKRHNSFTIKEKTQDFHRIFVK
jgi:hypothetical protein